MQNQNAAHPSSYKDPDGFIFLNGKTIYRQINQSYKSIYIQCDKSGLYDHLQRNIQLISHRITPQKPITKDGWKIIKPTQIPHISYPYEWTFSMLKDAALLTLSIQLIAISYHMSLKDASAYNIQFINGKPIFIDTLSFEPLNEHTPWIPYRQFCMHFLSPLLLSAYVDIRLLQLFKEHLDGIPLDLTSQLLPKKTWLNPLIATHIHLHAKSNLEENTTIKNQENTVSKQYSLLAHKGLIESLISLIQKLKWKLPPSRWGYYDELTSYSFSSFEYKKRIIEQLLSELHPTVVWDLGGNTGSFSRIAGKYAKQVLSYDIDPVAVERNYLTTKQNNESNILPLLLDLSNPTPGLGWNNEERSSWKSRGNADTILVLALIHHLVITYNLPFFQISQMFQTMCKNMIIEFIPKNDTQTLSLLHIRKDIFPWYSEDFFVKEFSKHFKIEKRIPIKGSKRILFFMKSKK
jgi:hypothetical protein